MRLRPPRPACPSSKHPRGDLHPLQSARCPPLHLRGPSVDSREWRGRGRRTASANSESFTKRSPCRGYAQSGNRCKLSGFAGKTAFDLLLCKQEVTGSNPVGSIPKFAGISRGRGGATRLVRTSVRTFSLRARGRDRVLGADPRRVLELLDDVPVGAHRQLLPSGRAGARRRSRCAPRAAAARRSCGAGRMGAGRRARRARARAPTRD